MGLSGPAPNFAKAGAFFSQTSVRGYKRQHATLQEETKMIRQPSSVIIAGPSGSGKSELLEQLLKEKRIFFPLPKRSSSVTTVCNPDLIT